MIPRYHTQWYLQHPVVAWYPGTMVPRYRGTYAVVLWNPGTVISRYYGTQWYLHIDIPGWYLVVPWYPMVLW